MVRFLSVLLLLGSLTTAKDDALYRRRAQALDPSDARGHFVLALWCEKHDLPRYARVHYRAVLQAAPRHRAALRALKKRPPLSVLLDEARDGDAAVRREAVTALAGEEAAARALADRALGDPVPGIRRAAVAGIRARKPAALFLPSLRSSSEAVRLRAIEALGLLGDPSAVAALRAHLAPPGAYVAQGGQVSYVQDFDVEVA